MGVAEEQTQYIDQALIEFAAASFHFEQLGHAQQCGRVENNLGFLYVSIGKFPEAHRHINRARAIFVSLGDQGLTAQVDDTRARALLSEGRYREAERHARTAVSWFVLFVLTFRVLNFMTISVLILTQGRDVLNFESS